MLTRRRQAPKIVLSAASRERLHRRRVALAVLRVEVQVNGVCDASQRVEELNRRVRQRRREVEGAVAHFARGRDRTPERRA